MESIRHVQHNNFEISKNSRGGRINFNNTSNKKQQCLSNSVLWFSGATTYQFLSTIVHNRQNKDIIQEI